MKRQMWELAGALLVVALAAAAWLVISRPGAGSASEAPAPSRTFPAPPTPTDEVTRDNAEARAQEIVNLLAEDSGLRELPGPDREHVLAAAKEQLAIYLSGSFERYLANMRELDAVSALTDRKTPPQELATLELLWRDAAATVAARPIAVKNAVVRVRAVGGKALPKEDLGEPSFIGAPARFDLGATDADVAERLLTLVEIAIPVDYKSPSTGASGHVWWGFWLARHPHRPSRWVMWRSVIYDPSNIAVLEIPAF